MTKVLLLLVQDMSPAVRDRALSALTAAQQLYQVQRLLGMVLEPGMRSQVRTVTLWFQWEVSLITPATLVLQFSRHACLACGGCEWLYFIWWTILASCMAAGHGAAAARPARQQQRRRASGRLEVPPAVRRRLFVQQKAQAAWPLDVCLPLLTITTRSSCLPRSIRHCSLSPPLLRYIIWLCSKVHELYEKLDGGTRAAGSVAGLVVDAAQQPAAGATAAQLQALFSQHSSVSIAAFASGLMTVQAVRRAVCGDMLAVYCGLRFQPRNWRSIQS